MARQIDGSEFRPMKVQVRPGSAAERYHLARAALPGRGLPAPRAIVKGIAPSPLNDLIFHGGKTVPDMQFQNLYVGGSASWKESDIASIDKAITLAMGDRRLNNVMSQYFPGQQISCTARESRILAGTKPAVVSQGDVEAFVAKLFRDGQLGASDLDATIFNLILPSGTVLNTNDAPTGSLVANKGEQAGRRARNTSDSLNGLGGYHGSVHLKTASGKRVTVYYSADAFSEILPDGSENGIAVFNQPWKNVVGTLYHELNEFRTDADVDDAIAAGNDPNGVHFLGWTSRRGQEIGDYPISVANPLTQVFREIKTSIKKFFLPVQFLYSNAVHGPEGPINKPHQ
jgi:hypothetical protein